MASLDEMPKDWCRQAVFWGIKPWLRRLTQQKVASMAGTTGRLTRHWGYSESRQACSSPKSYPQTRFNKIPQRFKDCCVTGKRFDFGQAAARNKGWFLFLAIVIGICGLASSSSSAATPDFVGMLAIAVEDRVAEKLELSAQQMARLLRLIDERESEALDLALSIKDLPPDQRVERLAPFRRKSEELGLAILSDEQRELLYQIRLRQDGLSGLLDPQVAQSVGLTDEEKAELVQLKRERDASLATADRVSRIAIRATFERKMYEALSQQSRRAWESLLTIEGQKNQAQGSVIEEAAGEFEAKPSNSQEFEAEIPADDNAPSGNLANELAKSSQPFPVSGPRLSFQFRQHPWTNVIEWFAEQAGLQLIMNAPPPGTFSYSDTQDYSTAEAIDILNGALLTQGYRLIRWHRFLILASLEDEIPSHLVPFVPQDQLDRRGEFEFISVLFHVERLTPQEAQTEIANLIGPQGAVVTLPHSGQLLVTDTAGRLRQIRAVLDSIDNPANGGVRRFELQPNRAQETIALIRQLLEISAETNTSADGGIRIAPMAGNTQLWVSGKPDKVAEVGEIIKQVNTAGGGDTGNTYLKVYSTGAADTSTILSVLVAALQDHPDVKITSDSGTGSIIAQARGEQHQLIQQTLDQLQSDSKRVDVVRLRSVDPQLAVISINKLFGSTADKPTANAPTVTAELSTRQLMIRGTETQISEIRGLLEDMGESFGPEDPTSRGNIRLVPITGHSADAALEQIQAIWRSMGGGNVRVVTPSAVAPTLESVQEQTRGPNDPPLRVDLGPVMGPQVVPFGFESVAPAQATQPRGRDFRRNDDDEDRRDRWRGRFRRDDDESSPNSASVNREGQVPVRLVSQPLNGADATGGAGPEQNEAEIADDQPEETSADELSEGPSIVVSRGPKGIMIASDDVEALNRFEDLLQNLATLSPTGQGQFSVFYLKYASADAVAETLANVLGGSRSGGGGGSIIGNLAGAALGDVGGGIVSGLLGGGSSGGGAVVAAGMMIVPDNRLNALIVQASPDRLNAIEQLLRVLDQPESPEEVLVQAKPQLIPVFNSSADEIATIVKEVYQDRMIGSSSGRGRGGPSPEDLFAMFRGGRDRGGRRGGGSQSSGSNAEPAKMSIGVDSRSNSLVVAAPDQLFNEVKLLVEHLDAAALTDDSDTVRVVSLKRSNSSTVEQALNAVLGEMSATSQSSSNGRGRDDNRRQRGNNDDRNDEQRREEFRRRMDFFNRMREGGGGGGFRGRGGD